MPAGKPQMRVQLGTIEVTDTDRRAIAWAQSNPLTLQGMDAGLADREDVREFLRRQVESSLRDAVRRFLNLGGQTASMERDAERQDQHRTQMMRDA